MPSAAKAVPAPVHAAVAPARSSTRASATVSDKLTIRRDRILVKPVKEVEVTPTGMMISAPRKVAGEAHFGMVVALGDKVSMDLAAGTTIMYHRKGTAGAHVDGEEMDFVPQSGIIGILE
ncbi:hypothetical protein FOA52_011194 [Chlamydomonas sp. UWO 241]|nr:hypothetical protein FOA52_011194 [Chlamydomonas sp. UWO 241]